MLELIQSEPVVVGAYFTGFCSGCVACIFLGRAGDILMTFAQRGARKRDAKGQFAAR